MTHSDSKVTHTAKDDFVIYDPINKMYLSRVDWRNSHINMMVTYWTENPINAQGFMIRDLCAKRISDIGFVNSCLARNIEVKELVICKRNKQTAIQVKVKQI
jgi:hypothetical protein